MGRHDCLLLSSLFHLTLPLCMLANTWLRRCCRSRIPVYLRVRPFPHYLPLPPLRISTASPGAGVSDVSR